MTIVRADEHVGPDSKKLFSRQRKHFPNRTKGRLE
jgi:hypothetical protein